MSHTQALSTVIRAAGKVIVLAAAMGYCWILLTTTLALNRFGLILAWLLVLSVAAALGLSTFATKAWLLTEKANSIRGLVLKPIRCEGREREVQILGRAAVGAYLIGAATLAGLGLGIAGGQLVRP